MMSLICGIEETNQKSKMKKREANQEEILNYKEQTDGFRRGGEWRGWEK